MLCLERKLENVRIFDARSLVPDRSSKTGDLTDPAERTTSLRACTTVVAPSALAISAPDATTSFKGGDVDPNIRLMMDGVGQHLEI